ncbi:MAG: FxsA family protein [Hyphomicrobiales bacterium]|nr:FxsA family protein [Hyphomicrobiales bacterium]
MSGRVILFLALASPVAELMSIAFVASLLGWLMTIGLLMLGAFLGVRLIRDSSREILAILRRQSQGNQAFNHRIGGLSRPVLAGLLLIIPGFLSDVVALTMLLDGARGWVAGRAHDAPRDKTIDLDRSAYRHIDAAPDDNKWQR